MKFLVKKEYIFIIAFISLFLSLYLGENSSGGTYLDYLSTKKFVDAFDKGFLDGFNWFLSFGQIHLHFFYLIKSVLRNLFSQFEIHMIYILISSLVPLVFYKILKKKYVNSDKYFLFLISLIIFLSPYFRSSAIWVTNDNLALLFFLISLYFFLCFQTKNNNSLYYPFLCFLFLILASYIRQNYALFSIFYFYYFFKNLNLLNFLYLNLLNILMSFPALIYFYFFISKDKSEISFTSDSISFDIIFSILVFSSLYFFYYIPIILNFLLKNNLFNFFKKNKKIIFFLLTVFLILSFWYTIPITIYGGGVFYKLSKLLNINFFYLFSFFGLFFLFTINKINFENLLIYLILVISFPLIHVYQKYFDPLIYVVFLSLINSKIIDQLFYKKEISIIYLFSYLGLFLTFSIFYHH